jgi:hypothetical protein
MYTYIYVCIYTYIYGLYVQIFGCLIIRRFTSTKGRYRVGLFELNLSVRYICD